MMLRSAQHSRCSDTDLRPVVAVPELTPGPGQLRIAVRAVGISSFDRQTVREVMREVVFPRALPAGLGTDVSGVVDRVGTEVTEFVVGDAVMGASLTSSLTDYALADPAMLVKKPAAISWEMGGSVARAGGVAYAVLNKLGVHSADTLLIHTAANGLGIFAVQLAVARGARVIAITDHKFDYLRSFGAEAVADGDGLLDRVRAIAPRGVDAVLDTSGRAEIPLSIVLAGGGERVLTLVACKAAAAGIQVHAGGAGSALRPALREIACLIEQGRLTVPAWPTYPLAQSAAGLYASDSGDLQVQLVVMP
jgi:NADPH:quinone reductase-like Zn-dependent oxidoreductase